MKPLKLDARQPVHSLPSQRYRASESHTPRAGLWSLAEPSFTAATTVQTAPTDTCDTTCTAATNSVAYPYTVPAGTTAPTATKLYNAAAITGSLTGCMTNQGRVRPAGSATMTSNG